MVKSWIRPPKPETEELKARLRAAGERLLRSQLQIKERKIPVIVLLEGWDAAGKGNLVRGLIEGLDPRFFRVASMGETVRAEEKYPFLHRYFAQIPEAGEITFLDSGWGSALVEQRVRGELSEEQYACRVNSVKRFERQLADNGYLLIKLFLQVPEKEQKRRMRQLEKNPDTAWRVRARDKWQNRHYEEYLAAFDKYLTGTATSTSPWYIVDARDKKWTRLQALEILCDGMDVALQNESLAVPILQNVYPLVRMPKLSEISLEQYLPEAMYHERLKELQKRLNALHYRLYRKQIPVIIAYEGWDAAGKGGSIRRITDALDPRGYEVYPIAGPEPHEKARHFLWRFWTRLPQNGQIAIFDRSWYGRVMVERLEGLCSTNDWQRAYNEINEFEKDLTEWGAVLIKFWVQIDKDTQLARFEERQNTLKKQWKITEEDWRNREKWDEYEVAADEMLEKTSTTYAPWYILESVDKRYARIKALEIVIAKLEQALA